MCPLVQDVLKPTPLLLEATEEKMNMYTFHIIFIGKQYCMRQRNRRDKFGLVEPTKRMHQASQ